MKRNVDLQLMALRMIQERNGVIPDFMQPGEAQSIEYSQAMVDTEEDKILQEVLRLDICDAIKQNESKLADIDLQIEPKVVFNFLCILLFLASLKWLYL